MKHRLLYILLFILLCGCNRSRTAMLDRAEALVDSVPASAMLVLDSLLPQVDDMLHSQQMRYWLLRTDAENQFDSTLRRDSIMRLVADYYDSHGTANESMLAYYLLGRTYTDRGEAPQALEAFHDAVDATDTTAADCNYKQLSRVYGQMAGLFGNQNIPTNAIEALDKAGYYSLLATDTVSYYIYRTLLISAYYELGELDSIKNITAEVCHYYDSKGLIKERSQSLLTAMRVCIQQEDYGQLGAYLNNFTISAFENSKDIYDRQTATVYYAFLGEYYRGSGDARKAEQCFRKAQLFSQDLQSKLLFYRGLMKVYEDMGLRDSMSKYANLYVQHTDSSVNEMSTLALENSQSMYNYNRHKTIAEQAEKRAEHNKMIAYALTLFILLIILTGYTVIRRIKRLNKQRIIAINNEYFLHLEQYEKARWELTLLTKKADDYRQEIHEKSQQIADLEKILSDYQEDKEGPQDWNLESSLLESNFVMLLHKQARTGRSVGEQEWTELRKMVNSHLPHFIDSLSQFDYQPNHRETLVCILIRLRFIPSEIAVLLDMSAQSLSNLRVRLLWKIYRIKGTAKEFNDKIQELS